MGDRAGEKALEAGLTDRDHRVRVTAAEGLWLAKKAEFSVELPMANSSMLVLPSMTNPAARARAVMVAS